MTEVYILIKADCSGHDTVLAVFSNENKANQALGIASLVALNTGSVVRVDTMEVF